MRVIGLLATYNEERFITACLKHLAHQGIDVYIIDNESEDQTVSLARQFLGCGVVGIETFPRRGVYSWRSILKRKEQLAAELEADWFMHVDADEIRLAPTSEQKLSEAFAEADQQGFNAVNFIEYAFVPTKQSPNHDHSDYLRTMRWYYPIQPSFPHHLKAWKKQAGRVELAQSGGHVVHFPGLRMFPKSFVMRHYLFLSADHALRKYVQRNYDPKELAQGWHRVRSRLRPEQIVLQDEDELRYFVSDDCLDPSNPLKQHPLFTTAGWPPAKHPL